MNNLYSVAKNEFKRYFASPLAYVYLISFLILNGSFAIYFGHFFERGRADLTPMFAFQPWLYLLFIPGISMRLWAEEFRNKTIVQIMTMPISASSLIWGKFLASWSFSALALFLTFPFWITVNILGSPDNAAITLSYIGSFVLAGCMLAISQTMSSITKNQVIALVLAVITNLLFFLSGLEYVSSFFRLFLPLSIVDMIASFSFITHFDTLSQGLLELRDIIFFASIIILFNFTTEIIISFKTSGTSKILKSGNYKHYILVFIFLLLGFVGLNLIANNFLRNIQFDVTEEKNFTLTPTTKKILQNLPNPVNAKLYYSKLLGERNPQFRLYFDKIRLMLEQYQKISDGQFSYQIFYSEPLSIAEDYALSKGLKPLPVVDKSQSVIFGMILNDSIDNEYKIPFFPLERQDFIEHDLSEAIYLLDAPKQNLAIITSLPLNSAEIENVFTPRWEIMNQLDKFYNTTIISNPQDLNNSYAALMIVHPTSLDTKMTQAIQDYSYHGGKVMLFADVAAEAARNFAPTTAALIPTDLNGLDKIWGFRYYPQAVTADLENSITVDASSDYNRDTNFTQDVIQFLLKEKNFNPLDSSTNRLKKILFASATIIEPDPDQPQVIFTPLITAGTYSSIMNADLVRQNVNPADLLRNFKPDNFHKIIAARLTSNNLSKAFDVIIVGDSDMLYDTYWGKYINLGENPYFVPTLDNANFVLNSLESLIGKNTLSELRGRSGKIRAFDDVEQIRKIGIQNFKIKEKEILDNIETAKKGIQEIWSKKTFEERETFTPDELALIAGIRKKLDHLRQDLQQIRFQTNTKLNRINALVKFFNIYAVPLFIALCILIYSAAHRKKKASPRGRLSRPARILIGISSAILLAGIASVHYNRNFDFEKYVDQPVFPSLVKEINDVQKFSLKNHEQQLNFYKENGLWKLEGYELYPVFQDRIRSFLSSLIEATYYEKKSDKPEHLSRFGLQPIELAGSPNINVELKNNKGKTIEKFEVGKYDLDIGRGSRAAYIKFADKFQVWTVTADFIDLSTSPNDWTYSTLWNLRLGRFITYNQETNPNNVAKFVKTILNTPLLSAQKELPNKLKKSSVKLLVEGNNTINLNFWTSANKYYINYEFANIPAENRLQQFEKSTKNNFYQINKSDMENINNVINSPRQRSSR